MKPLTFAWDSYKNKLNQLKHQVTFEEAESVFDNIIRIISARKATKNEINSYKEHL